MAAENFDGYAHVHKLMQKALNEDTLKEEIKETYAVWAKTYEKDMCISHSYSGATTSAELLEQKMKELGYTEDAQILDLGCGTGLVGVELQKHGYKNIDGVDLMPEMLEQAKAKLGVYRSLKLGSMGSPGCKDLGVDANQYDAVICVGVLVHAHVKRDGLDDLVHVLKPGGLACFGIRDFAVNATKGGYREKMDQLSEEGKWKFLAKFYEPAYFDDGHAWIFVYQKL